ncbi:hypothetical protein Mapa_007853 [Marchantia paleacea]|nr:hypothetical protein Mapa_007853 [Marchantia paleacea]
MNGFSVDAEWDQSHEVKSRVEEQKEVYNVQCWGCTQWLVLPSYAPSFKCGWCGALTIYKAPQPARSRWSMWLITFRDRAFVTIVLAIIASIVCGGVWAAFPVLFPTISLGLVFHSFVTVILLFNTLFNFALSSHVQAGPVGKIAWGEVGFVPRGGLEGHTFCDYCQTPKPASAHHCRKCGTCVMDMDHHCPFIGNCVGANNHRYFILFLLYIVISCLYVFVMGLYTGLQVWPSVISINHSLKRVPRQIPLGLALGSHILAALIDSPLLLSSRALALIYLVVASIAISTAVGLLLYQQVNLLYSGETFIDSLRTYTKSKDREGWDNLRRVFGNRHPFWWLLPIFKTYSDSSLKKIHVR